MLAAGRPEVESEWTLFLFWSTWAVPREMTWVEWGWGGWKWRFFRPRFTEEMELRRFPGMVYQFTLLPRIMFFYGKKWKMVGYLQDVHVSLSFFGWFSTEPWLCEKGYVKLWNVTLYTLTSMVWKLHVWRGWSISIPPIFHLCHGMALKSNFPSKLNSIFVCPVIGQHPTRNLAFKPLRPFGYLAQKKTLGPSVNPGNKQSPKNQWLSHLFFWHSVNIQNCWALDRPKNKKRMTPYRAHFPIGFLLQTKNMVTLR